MGPFTCCRFYTRGSMRDRRVLIEDDDSDPIIYGVLIEGWDTCTVRCDHPNPKHCFTHEFHTRSFKRAQDEVLRYLRRARNQYARALKSRKEEYKRG